MQKFNLIRGHETWLGLILAASLLYAHLVIGDQIATGLLYAWYGFLGMIGLGIVLLIAYGIRSFVAYSQIKAAEAQKAMAEAIAAGRDIRTFPRGDQVYQFGVPGEQITIAHHLDPMAYRNGHYQKPTPEQMNIFNQYIQSFNQQINNYNTTDQPVKLIDAPTTELPLLPALANCDNILIVGGKGTGKTSLLQHLEAQRLTTGQMIILDSHAQPGQWQGDMIGLGRNYQAIKETMIALTDKLHKRYQRWAKGENDFTTVNTIIDEFTLLPRMLKDVGYDIQAYSIPALTEGRKVKINCLWGIHSNRVTALGLQGAGDLRECFDAIVYLKNVDGQRYALVDFGDGVTKIRYAHPGPFYQVNRPKLTAPLQAEPPVSASDQGEIDNDTQGAIDTYYAFTEADTTTGANSASSEFSWRKATKSAFGDGKFGETYKAKLTRIWDQQGLDYSHFE